VNARTALSTAAVLFATTALADVAAEVAAPPPEPTPAVKVWVQSAPQLGHLGLGGEFQLAGRFSAELGGWNVFGTDDAAKAAFLRGGWAGVRMSVLEAPKMKMTAWVRGIGIQPAKDVAFTAGVSAGASTVLNMLPWLTLVPDFDITWLRTLTQARLVAAYRFVVGEWTLDARGGAQLWVQHGEVSVAPLVELGVAWRHSFSTMDLGLSGGLALTRDGAALVGHPLMQHPQDIMQPWAFLRVSIAPHVYW